MLLVEARPPRTEQQLARGSNTVIRCSGDFGRPLHPSQRPNLLMDCTENVLKSVAVHEIADDLSVLPTWRIQSRITV